MSKEQQMHDVYTKVKELALELGRTPKILDLEGIGITRYEIDKIFGGMIAIQQACGLKPNKEKKIDNTIFNKDIEKHLESFEPASEIKPYVIKKKDAKFATISDIHWPFRSKVVLDKFYEFIKEHQPDFVIINGDAWDMYAHSKYPKSINVYTPRDEEALAREMNEEFWKSVKKACPKAKCFQLLGNHDIRPLKRVLETYPAAEDWVNDYFKKLFTFDGVETIFNARQELQINDDLIFHGYRSKLGDHRDYTHMNCHNGHSHVGGTVFRRIKGVTIFECNSGVAGDIESKALSYTPQQVTHQTPGFSFRDKYGPRFVAC